MSTEGNLRLHIAIATIAGVLALMLLGAELMAFTSYSSDIGTDEEVTNSNCDEDRPGQQRGDDYDRNCNISPSVAREAAGMN